MDNKTITVRCEGADVRPVDCDLADVTLRNISLNDFLAEFNTEQILECMPFDQVFDWAVSRHDENEDD